MQEGTDAAHWQRVCAEYGWAACPLAFHVHHHFVHDNPVAAAASSATATRQLSVGIPHPHYGVMRATMVLTGATSLTRLAEIAHRAAAVEYATSEGMPHLYVGGRAFTDRIGDDECTVLGVLVYVSATHDVQCAPLGLVRWVDMWLPYFEDVNEWVMTGWDRTGKVSEIHKPFGWGSRPLGPCSRDASSRAAGAMFDMSGLAPGTSSVASNMCQLPGENKTSA